LIGGKHFTVPCTLAYNGYGVQTSALVDSGANGLVFIDTRCAADLAKFLNVALTPLPTPCSVKGFDGKPGRSATHAIILNLGIDGHRQQKIPMLILDLGNHDLILGRRWLSHFDIWLDVRNRRLLWPDQPRERSMTQEICTTRENLRPQPVDPQHQAEVIRRDQAFGREDAQRIRQILPRSKDQQPLITAVIKDRPSARDIERRSERITQRDNLRKMEQELRGISRPPPKAPRQKPTPENLPKIDIAMIGAAGFHRLLRHKDNTLFATSLYEIDRIIEEKEGITTLAKDTLTADQLVDQKLPAAYNEYRDVFSKAASDQLPPHRSYDHKIILEGENTIGFSPLYNYNVEEL